MLLEVIKAQYLKDYKIQLSFNDGTDGIADLENTLKKEKREIFFPLKEKAYFRNFEIRFNTVCWQNEADFAPEFLKEIVFGSF